MNADYTIRKARKADAGYIIRFNIAMAKETEGRELKHAEIEPGVHGLFIKSGYGFYLVAEAGERVIGSLMVTYEWSDWRNGLIWWIQSVYVVPEYRRKGVYRTMYRYVKELAADNPEVCGFRLYVEKENFAAQRTYASLGMKETDYKLFEEIPVD